MTATFLFFPSWGPLFDRQLRLLPVGSLTVCPPRRGGHRAHCDEFIDPLASPAGVRQSFDFFLLYACVFSLFARLYHYARFAILARLLTSLLST